ncbi:hypothetical protein V5E97_07790 [Singulisphaera sp. Ch08]|uniref:Uncharacterized protein n=1 Tax=Singulisphaera sp. Ch08 TaxID=3120278 RepID=A0AAU7CLN5_9BACT
MNTTLSETALSLLRVRLTGQRVEVTDENRPLYRELAASGLAIPLHTFTGGDESAYRLTEAAVSFVASYAPSPEESLSPADLPEGLYQVPLPTPRGGCRYDALRPRG